MEKISLEDNTLHQKFKDYGANAKLWIRKCVFLLPEIERKLIWRKKGFENIYVYARKLAGMSRNAVDDALRILAQIADKPALMKIAEEKGINAVRPVVTIATVENADFWAEKASQMSKHTLEIYIKEMRELEQNGSGGAWGPAPAPGSAPGLTFELFQTGIDKNQIGLFESKNDDIFRTGTENPNRGVSNDCVNVGSLNGNLQVGTNCIPKKILAMELNPKTIEQLEKLKGQNTWEDLMEEFIKIREQKFEDQKPLPVTETNPGNCSKLSRYIPAKIESYLIKKYNGQCVFPHCKQAYQIIHHTQRWALNHIHDPDKMVLLCKGHERLVHLGLVKNEDAAPADWKLRAYADQGQPKYKVDLIVQKFRVRG